MKTIVVSCGTGIMTSTTALRRIENELDDRGLLSEVQFIQCPIAEVEEKSKNADLIVATSSLRGNVSVPFVSGTPFLTGIGIGKCIDEIIEKLGL